MLRLASILYSIVGTALAGAAIVAVLTMGMTEPMDIIVAAAVGAVLALPVSYFIARAILNNR